MEFVADAGGLPRLVEVIEHHLELHFRYTGRASARGQLTGLQELSDREAFIREMPARLTALTTGPTKPGGAVSARPTGPRMGIGDFLLTVNHPDEQRVRALGRALLEYPAVHYAALNRSTAITEIELLLKIDNGTWNRAFDVSVPGTLGEVNYWSERTLRSLGATEEH